MLVPEPRADKNGKLVTRHVRTEVPASTSKRAMPAPEVFNEQSQELARQIGMAVSDIGSRSVAEMMQAARRVPAETAGALLEARKTAIASSGFDYCLVLALQSEYTPDFLENFALIYNDDLHYDLFENSNAVLALKTIASQISGLQHYPDLHGIKNYYRADEGTRRKAIALTAILPLAELHDGVTITHDPNRNTSTFLSDDRLARITMDNAGTNLRDFLNLAHERGCNVDAIEEGLSTPQPLRGGAL